MRDASGKRGHHAGPRSLRIAHPQVLNRENGTGQVQIVWGKTAGKRKVEHVGSGRADEEIDLLMLEAWEHINTGQGTLDLGVGEERQPGAPVEKVGSQMVVLLNSLDAARRALGLNDVTADMGSATSCTRGLLRPPARRPIKGHHDGPSRATSR